MGKVNFDFRQERYVVTGASSGMGRKVTMELAVAGAEVLAIGRNKEHLEEVRDCFPQHIFPMSVDVCDPASLKEAIDGFVRSHGKLHGAVHAAGVVDFTPLRNYDDVIARKIMDTSFWAGMELLRLVTKSTYGNQGTSTVLFSSVASQSHEKGMFAYAAAKSALDAGIRSVAKEIVQRKHRVNTILPGWVQSPMTEVISESNDKDPVLQRQLLGLGLGCPEDVSKVVLFLLSDAARWITGSNIAVDGGYLA